MVCHISGVNENIFGCEGYKSVAEDSIFAAKNRYK